MIRAIFLNELRGLVRDRRVALLAGLCALLLGLAAWSGARVHGRALQDRERAERLAREQWENLGAYHPHAAGHFGDYAHKPLGPLARLDAGVQSFTGKVIHLEAHAQNAAVGSEISSASSLVRFGPFQPALILHLILPLLVLFTAFASVSRERESGVLRLLVIQGARLPALLLAKALAHASLAWCLLAALVGLELLRGAGGTAAGDGLDPARLGLSVLAHGAFLLLAAMLGTYVSARASSSRAALATLLAGWLAFVVVLPRVAAQLADDLLPLPSRAAFERGMAEDRAQGLDGHNPADARRRELEQRYLVMYGVGSVAELPLDFGGVVMQADEEYGNQVWDVHYGRLQGLMGQQAQVLQLFSFVNPYQALRSLSMALSGTDLFHDIDFQRQAEAHRRWLIAALNREHAHGGGRTGQGGWTAQPEFFRSLLAFRYEPRPAGWALRRRWPEAASLGLWLLGVFLLLRGSARTVPVVRS